MLRGIVFDLDGTILDSIPILSRIAGDLMEKELGIPREIGEKYYKETSGIPFVEQLKRSYYELFHSKLDDKRASKLNEIYQSKVSKNLKMMKLFPDVKKTLPYLSEKYFLFISTSTPQERLYKILETNKIKRYFRAALGLEKGFEKTKHFKFIEDVFELGRSEIIFVGDTPYDYEVGIENNVLTILRCGTFKREDLLNFTIFVIRDFNELIEVIEKF